MKKSQNLGFMLAYLAFALILNYIVSIIRKD